MLSKYCFLFIVLIALSNVCFGQKVVQNESLDKKTFTKILNEQFSNLVTGQSKTSIGNFAALDLKETEVSFSGNTITKKGSVFGVKASGGISDGLFSIFNNSKFNSKISLEAQANIITINKKRQLTYFDDSFQAFKKKDADIREKYRSLIIAAENSQEITLLKFKKIKTEKILKTLSDRLTKVKKINDALNTVIERGGYLVKDRDSLLNELAVTTMVIDSLRFSIDLNKSDLSIIETEINNNPGKIIAKERLENQRSIEIKAIKPDLELYAFKFDWMSLSYKVENSSFKLFNPDTLYQNQVTDSSYISHDLKIQYNHYYWTKEPYKSHFWCFGLSFSVGDNLLTDLTKKELADTRTYNPSPNSRASSDKYNVYEGDSKKGVAYKNGIKKFKLYADYYHFLFDNNVAAFHIYPELQISKESKPIYNLGFGFLFAFKDSKNENKSVVNAELYYNFLDLPKYTETDLKLFKRNNIGIRFSFPINFIN